MLRTLLLLSLILALALCQGQKPSSPERIVGGNAVSVSQYPYQLAVLQRNGANNYVVYCGASILTNQWVLSAAHCFVNITLNNAPTNNTPVYVSSTSTISSVQDSNAFVVQQIIIHPNYTLNAGQYLADLALLRLANPLTLSTSTQQVILARPIDKQNFVTLGTTEATVTGFGLTQTGGTVSNQLNAVSVPTLTAANCFSRTGLINLICAGTLGRDSCNGDSGGPLVITVNNTFIQVGVVSLGTGSGCGGQGDFGAYLDASALRSYIESNTGALPTYDNPPPPAPSTSTSSQLLAGFALLVALLFLF